VCIEEALSYYIEVLNLNYNYTPVLLMFFIRSVIIVGIYLIFHNVVFEIRILLSRRQSWLHLPKTASIT